MSIEVWQLFVAVFGSAMASSGFWAWLIKRGDQKDATTQLLLGMAHMRIMHIGEKYIRRGYITKEEYDDFITYLYNPYESMGGNGLARRMKLAIDELPISRPEYKNGA